MKRSWLVATAAAAAVIGVGAYGVTTMMPSGSPGAVANSAFGQHHSTTDYRGAPGTSANNVKAVSGQPANPGQGMNGSQGMNGGSGTAGGDVVRRVRLGTMPTGSVVFGRTSHGLLDAHVSISGLTPGSVHTVSIDAPGFPNPVTTFNNLQANALGQASAVLDSLFKPELAAGSRFVLRLGLHGGDGEINALAAEPIAQTSILNADFVGHSYVLTAVDIATNGVRAGTLSGQATLTYSPATHTVTVEVHATGLTPGNHATHIHEGTCQAQGKPKYMPANDFVADQHGDINATRVIANVPSNPLTAGFYLNIHQGDSMAILQDNAPTLSFRPLLCANL